METEQFHKKKYIVLTLLPEVFMLLFHQFDNSDRPNPVIAGAIRQRPISTTFGLRLRTLRNERGYTQTQLADYLGIDRSFISDVERGKKSMSLTFLETVAQGFHMSLSELTRDL